MILFFCGLFIHAVLLVSVFEIYFKSPIIQGIEPYTPQNIGPAQRVVLLVTDGLRADSFYKLESDKTHSPFLRSIIEKRGSWGVSHTRVPTETRPGHVALIAGFYEDPSAIVKGWKENPVEFDSTFNESRYTWSWGSPDVLPMFAKGASGDHVFVDTYSADDEDFSGAQSTTKLDTWVFDKVEDFLNQAKANETLYKMLHSDKIILFLHLLGLDSAGHTHKPHSKEYSNNIQVVDDGIRKIEQIIEEFYFFDNRTAYVMTADHGMTDWGSHGAGDVSETETPLLAWGAGISGPLPVKTSHASPKDWYLHHLERRDVKQADIAPLISCLIGAPIPVNSVGSLPIDYLDVSEKQLSEAMLSNTRQMTAQYSKSREDTEFGTISWLYKPFKELSKETEAQMLQDIQSDFLLGNHKKVIAHCSTLMSLALAGLNYYQNYYQLLLLSCVSLTFIGWITWLAKCINDVDPEEDTKDIQIIRKQYTLWERLSYGGILLNAMFLSGVIATAFLIHVQHLPLQFHVYCILPEVIWWSVARHHSDYMEIVRSLRQNMGEVKMLQHSLLYLAGIEIMVASFFHRWVLSIGVVGLAVWPLTKKLSQFGNRRLLFTWLASCAMLAVFPLLPVVGRDSNIYTVVISGCLWLAIAIFLVFRPETHLVYDNKKDGKKYLGVTLLQVAMIPVAVWNLQTMSASFANKDGLLLFNQLLSWTMFGLSFILVLLGSRWMLARLLNVSLALAVPFLLLSVTHEGLFLLALNVNMLCWLAIEYSNAKGTELSECTFKVLTDIWYYRPLESDDFRRAFFFLLYIIVSFFGTGNVASVNSFDPAWVRAFISVFSPFTMALLILCKTMIPFLTVTCAFRAINIVVRAPINQTFLMFLVFGDIMGLHFLFMVTNKGSWLDIGTSISHFVIIQSIVLFLVLLYGVAGILTGFSLWPARTWARRLRPRLRASKNKIT